MSSQYEGIVEGFDDDFKYKECTFGPPFFMPTIEKCENFKFDKSDIVLAAFPKTGNTWAEEIIWLICNNADVEASTKKHIMERFPLMELKYGPTPAFVELLAQAPPPRFINTHLPFHIMKNSLEEGEPKIVLLMRNPKDQTVSFWHFINAYPGRKCEKFNDFFKLFREEKTAFGSYIKHCAGWYKEIDRPNVFFITYEQLKADHRGSVEKIAKFLEKDLTAEQIDTITEATSMASMKKRNVSKGATVDSGDQEIKGEKALSDKSFFRKGIVGDWKSVFSNEQSEYMDQLCRETLEPLGLKFHYDG